jgi:cytidylate kinase
MYRTVALKVLQSNIDLNNKEKVIKCLNSADIQVVYEDGHQIMLLDGKDVTSQIRIPEISKAASDVATIPEVRLKLVELQRKIASEHSLVMDGRDIGTFVLPNATKKFFLTASVEERAKRRWKEMCQNGKIEIFENVMNEIKQRDFNDSRRSFAPLRKAEDAILIDTTNLSIEEVVNQILESIKECITD